MPIRITGLNSGLDTESIISALVSSYNYKTQKYEKAQTKLSWKQNAWKNLNTKIYSLYSSVGNLRFSKAYNLKSATVSDSTKVSVTAGSGAVNGSYSIQVTSLAKSGYLTGGKLSKEDGSAVSASTTLGDLGYKVDSTDGKIMIGGRAIQVDKTEKVDGKDVTTKVDLVVNKNTKISDVIAGLKNAGVNANFDATNGRIYISAQKAGAENDFNLSATDENSLKALGLVEINEFIGNTLTQVPQTDQNGNIEVDTDGNTVMKALGDTTLSDLNYNLGDGKISVNGKEISVDGNTKVSDFIADLNSVGVSASLTDGKIKINQSAGGEALTLEAKDDNGSAALVALGLKEFSSATRVEGSSATIYVNGARYESDSNSFSVNGLTINANAITSETYNESEAVNATVSADTQGIYDKIKDFLSQYNALINEMTSLYNADSASGYEPLTDEERDSLSDAEVEKWEAKIKDSLLRRDDTLYGVMNAMTNTMAKGIEVKGETYYLSDFGIKTLGYLNAPKNEHYAYHIDGDEDDVNSAGNADKLMQKLATDPDVVIEYMQKLSQNLYEAVDAKMKSTSLSSVYTVYNDKEMASEYSDYTSLIRKWQERLEDQQDYYYKKFSAMETALAKLNSQTSSMSGFFG